MGSALALFVFPVLSTALASGVFWVIALAPLMGLVASVARAGNGSATTRTCWKPSGSRRSRGLRSGPGPVR
ncbi:hypothetical protein [Saccharopolyspora halophila]|uniref:hypothetical protein n=1 Tax=Saccharopolyspora halophila TaxID=405551 RepID=UPI0031E4940E